MKQGTKKILLLFLIFSGKFFGQEVSSDIESRFERGPQIVSEKGTLQIEEVIDCFKGKRLTLLESRTAFSYGVLHQLGIRGIIPGILRAKDGTFSQQAFGDITLLVDWHFFRKPTYLMTLSAGLKLPTASKPIEALSAAQSFDFPIELQAFFSTEQWYAEADYFALIKGVNRKKKRFGDAYFFSYALGPKYRISSFYLSKFLLLGRITGLHTRPTLIEDVVDENSGGTGIFLGPDLIWANDKIVLRGLFQLPIVNRLFGMQNKADFRVLFSIKVLI